jgi:hypothetical protein
MLDLPLRHVARWLNTIVELGLEGTLNGATDSRVDIPTALPASTISTLSPNVVPLARP